MRVSGNRRPRGGRSNTGNGRSGTPGGRGNSGNNNRRSNNGNRSYDSNGPDGKIRGSATQVYDKYISLGRDAQTSGDHVGAENYYQHAEHYYRIMLLNNLVKLDRSSDDDDDDENSVNDEGSSEDNDVQSSENTREEKKPNAPKVQKIALAPIIIDLSDPDGSDVSEDKPESDDEDQAVEGEVVSADGEATSENVDDDPDKPKSKRRVSRTRGLRRRTTRKKTSDEENDEPQSA